MNEFAGDPVDNLAQSLRAVVADEVRKALEARTEFAKLLSVAEVADLLGVSQSTVRNLIRSGQLEAHHVRGRKMIDREEVERYLAA